MGANDPRRFKLPHNVEPVDEGTEYIGVHESTRRQKPTGLLVEGERWPRMTEKSLYVKGILSTDLLQAAEEAEA